MSVQVTINGDTLDISEVRPEWVSRALHLDKLEGDSPCIRVAIVDPKVTLTLSTAGCGGGGRGVGTFTSEQQYIIELWRKHHMDRPDISPGNVVSFLKALERDL